MSVYSTLHLGHSTCKKKTLVPSGSCDTFVVNTMYLKPHSLHPSSIVAATSQQTLKETYYRRLALLVSVTLKRVVLRIDVLKTVS